MTAEAILGMKTKQKFTIECEAIKFDMINVPYKKYHNFLQVKHQKWDIKNFKVPGFPFYLQIEPTNMCNLSCPLCPRGMELLNRKQMHMRYKDFKIIVDDMDEYILLIKLFDKGEPFLNPELPDMIQYASERGIKTVTSTNAHFLLNNKYVSRILKSGLSALIISIDSLKKDIYEKYRIGGSLDKALLGLKNVIRLKRELKVNTLINLRMLANRYNETEIKDMIKFSRSVGVDIFSVKNLNPSCGLSDFDKEFIPNNPIYRRYKYKKNTFERIQENSYCDKIWYTCEIHSNGDVVPCCEDYNGELKFGNVYEKPLSEIWNSQTTYDLRKRLFLRKDSNSICKKCYTSFKHSNLGSIIEYYDFTIPEIITNLKKILFITKRFIYNMQLYPLILEKVKKFNFLEEIVHKIIK